MISKNSQLLTALTNKAMQEHPVVDRQLTHLADTHLKLYDAVIASTTAILEGSEVSLQISQKVTRKVFGEPPKKPIQTVDKVPISTILSIG